MSPGDTSPAGMLAKAKWVLDEMERRMSAFGGNWSQTTGVQLYTVQDVYSILESKLGRRGVLRNGLTWHFNRRSFLASIMRWTAGASMSRRWCNCHPDHLSSAEGNTLCLGPSPPCARTRVRHTTAPSEPKERGWRVRFLGGINADRQRKATAA